MDDFNADAPTNEVVDEPIPIKNQETADFPTQSQGEARDTSKVFAAPKKTSAKRRRPGEDPRVAYAFDVLKTCSIKETDECSTFGEHIASKLRKFDDMTRTKAMHHINTVMFQIELDYYRNIAHAPQQQQQQTFTLSPNPSPSTSIHQPSWSPSPLHNTSSYSDSMSPLQDYLSTFTDL